MLGRLTCLAMAGSICCNGMAGNVKKNSWESQESGAEGVDRMKQSKDWEEQRLDRKHWMGKMELRHLLPGSAEVSLQKGIPRWLRQRLYPGFAVQMAGRLLLV